MKSEIEFLTEWIEDYEKTWEHMQDPMLEALFELNVKDSSEYKRYLKVKDRIKEIKCR